MKRGLKRNLVSAGLFLMVLIFSGLMGISAWICKDCKENIQKVQAIYSGSAEEALITFLEDPKNSTYDRTHLAIWTLGQIRSEKALPLLKNLYQNDPEGALCYGLHNSMLCQREIFKAIQAIENWSPFTHQRLKGL